MSQKTDKPTDNDKDTDSAQGQQQNGNHGGSRDSKLKEGNQLHDNSAEVQQRDVDGDLPHGSKGKK